MKTAVYPGSFDPITNGHLEMIERASRLFDKVYVLVSINPKKKYIFSNDERKKMIEKACEGIKNIEIVFCDSLVVDFAHKVNANCIIRGIRNHSDFDSEQQLAYYNNKLDSNIETILLFPTHKNLFVSSTSIKELVKFNQDIAEFVPAIIKQEIEEKIRKRL